MPSGAMAGSSGSTDDSAADGEDPFRALVELLPVAVYVCDAPTGVISFYNARAAELWGREPRVGDTDERFCGSFRLWRPDGSFLAHDQTPMADAVLAGRAARNEEVVIERPDGTRITVLANVDPILDAAGRVACAINVFSDTTVLARDQKVRARLAAIVESSNDAILSKDLNGTIKSWNQGATRLFGYTASEAIGKPITMLIPQERRDEEPQILARLRRGERIERFETVRTRKDGSLLNVSWTASPIRDDRGKVVGASTIARDVTERNEMMARVALEQETTARLYEIGKCCVSAGSDFIGNLTRILDAAIWIGEADKGNVHLFDEVSETLKLAVHRGFETPFLEFFGDVARGEASACGAAFRSKERMIVEDITTSRIFSGQPSEKVLLGAGVRAVQSTPLVSSKGTVLGMISTHYRSPRRPSGRVCRWLDVLARQVADYIEQQRAEQQREDLLHIAERAREDAETANRAKDEFLAMLGHELRNPLSAVRNSITAAVLDDQNRSRALEIAQRQTDQLSRIVDDLLDVARITRGRVLLRKRRTYLAEVLQRSVDATRALMDERGHSVSVSLPAEEIHLDADAARIEQVVANLLSNAAKYSDPGGSVAVSAERERGDAVIRVRDNGSGIAAELLPRVFDLFVQGSRSLDRAQGGLGIGLTLVRRIVELHGGAVEARSPGLGGGSEFIVRLPALPGADEPLASRTDKPAMPGKPRAQHPARALMVEDNVGVAESLAMILERYGHHVRVVHDGALAVQAARANMPDLMLIDIGLPGMNGYEVAQAIRDDADLKHLVLVALTGYGAPEDRARAMAAGFDYHLVKPVDLDALQDLVGRLSSAAPPTRLGGEPGMRH